MEKSRFVSYEYPPPKIDTKPGSYFMIPNNLQSCRLGSLLLFEFNIFNRLYYPNAKFSNLRLSYEDNKINEYRRNRLYKNFGYEIKDHNAIFIGLDLLFPQHDYNFEIISLKGSPIKPYELLHLTTSCIIGNKI